MPSTCYLFLDSPLNKTMLEKHEKAKKLHEQIMAATTDTEWLNCLLEAENDDFIVQNIEWRLSDYPCNLKIWNFYFDYFTKLNDIVSFKNSTNQFFNIHICNRCILSFRGFLSRKMFHFVAGSDFVVIIIQF